LDQIVEKGRPAPGFHHGDGPGNAVQEIMIPASKAGLVIGKGGETIKQLQVLFCKMIPFWSTLKPAFIFPLLLMHVIFNRNGLELKWL
jgi:hypothetical protein